MNKDHPQADELFDPDKLPGFHDPFAGGGALPMAAQRLGLESQASDLNPVAVLINKAMIEVPPRFAGQAPVNSVARSDRSLVEREWLGASGLAEDVRYYGRWMRDEAERRIGHLYPPVTITDEIVTDRPDLKPYHGEKLTVIAWIWARTVMSPNPAFKDVHTPLVSSFILSNKAGNKAFVTPIVHGRTYRFVVSAGEPPPEAKDGTKLGRGTFRCLLSSVAISTDYIKEEAQAGRMQHRLLAVVTKGTRGRIYLSPTQEMVDLSKTAKPDWQPDTKFYCDALGFRVGNYGMMKWSDLFTPRQLVALSTLNNLVDEARVKIEKEAILAGMKDDKVSIVDGGTGARARAEATSVYLAFGVSKTSNRSNALSAWMPSVQCPGHLFSRQAIAMCWDFAEANIITGPSGSFLSMTDDV